MFSVRTVYARPRPRERATRAAAPDERIHGTRVGVARRTPSTRGDIRTRRHTESVTQPHHRTDRTRTRAGRDATAPRSAAADRLHTTRSTYRFIVALKRSVIISRDAQPRPRTALACCVLAVAPRDLTYARTHTQRVDSPLMFAHHALSSSQAHNAFSASR